MFKICLFPCVVFVACFFVVLARHRGVLDRLGENLEQETQLEDSLVKILNQQAIKESLDSVGQYVGLIGTGLSAGLGTILGNTEQVLKSLQKK